MYLTTAEKYMTAKLQCDYANLELLDNLYSELGEECTDPDTLVRDSESLNDLIYSLYIEVTSGMVEYLTKFVNNTADSEEDTIDDYIETEYCEETQEERKRIHDRITRAVEENIKKLENSSPYTNRSDSRFDNDLDQVVDWDYSIHDNAINLIKYWVKQLED